MAVANTQADIEFTEVTIEVGLSEVGSGKTSGAAWRDFNGDGWPDLWLSNHDSKPSLYINQDGERFIDVIDEVWDGDPLVDTHGAAWADYDNDGDQDLFELAGGGSGTGSVANHFYVNQNQTLSNKAGEHGLSLARGRGRMPLWLDVDKDGMLDVLAVNVHNPNNEAPSTLFRQSEGRFQNANNFWSFDGSAPSKWSKILDMLRNATDLEFGKPTYFNGIGFAQLANLRSGAEPELMLFNWPVRTFEVTEQGLKEYSAITFPKGYTAEDAALEDFNGDGVTDFFFASGTKNLSGAEQIQPNLLGVRLIQGDSHELSVSFTCDQAFTLSVTPYWVSKDNFVLGEKKVPIRDLQRELKSSDLMLHNRPTELSPGVVSIYYLEGEKRWYIKKIGATTQEIAFTLKSVKPFEHFAVAGLPSTELVRSVSLLSQPDGSYRVAEHPAASPAHSVAAGDFDNDGDVDLFVVRADQLKNLSDVTLINDGSGDFRALPIDPAYKTGRGDSATTADYNNDGFLDVFVTNGLWPAPFPSTASGNLYKNSGNENNWLKIDLQGTQSNRDGIGVMVLLENGNGRQWRVQGGGIHASSQNEKTLHFGLGMDDQAKKLTVHWPSGKEQIIQNVPANQTLKIVEPMDH